MLTTINGPQYMSDICHGPIYSLGRLCGAICIEKSIKRLARKLALSRARAAVVLSTDSRCSLCKYLMRNWHFFCWTIKRTSAQRDANTARWL